MSFPGLTSVDYDSSGASSFARFQRHGQLSDLEDAVSMSRHAVNATPDDDTGKPNRLRNLSTCLATRFQRLGKLSDLEDAISAIRDAVTLTPHSDPDRGRYLGNLGKVLLERFQRFGELGDIEDAISTLKAAVNLTPHDHPGKLGYLVSLGGSFITRFNRLGELNDIEDAISTLQHAVDNAPPDDDHPYKSSCLNNLGAALSARFERLKQLGDLDAAISKYRDLLELTPHGHPSKAGRVNNLASALQKRFDILGQLNDLEGAISMFKDSVELTPPDHPNKPNRLSNLGDSLVTRFQRLGQLSDIDHAISVVREAVFLVPYGHPEKPQRLNSLGDCYRARFDHLGEVINIEQAIAIYSHVASVPLGSISTRFRASQKWISSALLIHHHSLLHAYSVALSLLPQLAWIGLSLFHRYEELAKGADIVREAAAAALDAEFPQAAVEWLEQGRCIVWGELFQLRSSYEELSTAHPDHARQLRELSAELDQVSATRETSSKPAPAGAPQPIEPSRQVAEKQRRLAIERDQLLQKIRRFPGFEQFLRPKRFSQIRPSAHAGPVVILNAAETRCDALIVLADVDHVIHVPLTKFTYKQSVGLQHIMKDFVREARVGRRATLSDVSWESILSSLWTNVVRPVLDAVAFSEPRDLSRIFWCPTGSFTFLPIHAAGLYGTQYSRPGHKLSDFHISSYVPTLSILALSLGSSLCTTPINDLRILAVRQPPSDGLSPLSGVGSELEHIQKVIRKSPAAQTIFVEPSQGTVEGVLGLMKDADWVHFACHGVQDSADATQSGLCLANGRRLALRDIIALKRPGGGLAFLSACETAKGDVRLSEEATHIAAGMLFAGYGGVVGTTWTISDRLAPEIAKNVYGYLFRDGKRPDYRDAARALHEAIGRARREGASFSKWIPFIHLGH